MSTHSIRACSKQPGMLYLEHGRVSLIFWQAYYQHRHAIFGELASAELRRTCRTRMAPSRRREGRSQCCAVATVIVTCHREPMASKQAKEPSAPSGGAWAFNARVSIQEIIYRHSFNGSSNCAVPPLQGVNRAVAQQRIAMIVAQSLTSFV